MSGDGAPGPAFDGRTYPYLPPRRPPEAVAGLLHAERTEVDSTTFEVLRHGLWNLNMEHGNAIIRTSGSPVVVYAHDFNPVILDEAGDYVFFGPWLQYLVAATSPAVKWILEHRHPRPGIEPGCMFMTNDPWIGATHQSDLTMLAPVFWEGRVFAWVGNSLHHQDLGGTAPGGFNPVAADIFWESGVIPPVRVVEDGELRVDLEEEFMRRSRMPELVAVDLRAQIAGCKVAASRMETLLGRYGPATVKGVMKKIQDDSEAAFLRRMETIPDGEWREEAFLEMAVPGDRGLYRNSLVLRKIGDRLEFSNEGTDPQIGTLGCTLAAWSGAIGAMVNAQLMFDQLFAVQGALRHIDFRAEPGTLTSALHPSALSLAPLTLDQCIALAGLCISKMLSASADPELRKEGASCMGCTAFPIAAFSGAYDDGRPFATLFLEPVGAGMPGSAWKDGIDVGGWPWDPQVVMPNVEEFESTFPILYLWKRVLPDSGGAGRFRGGNSMDLGVIVHGVDQIAHHTASAAHCAIPGPPLAGGYPSSLNTYTLLRDTDVLQRFGDGVVPGLEELAPGASETLPAKAFGVAQGTRDVYVMSWTGAGGYGDPIERPPEAVLADVSAGSVTAGEAERLYGVVIGDGAVDAAATAARRALVHADRLTWSGPEVWRTAAAGSELRSVGPELAVVADGDGQALACGACLAVLAPVDGNWKDGARVREAPLEEGNRHLPPAGTLTDEDVVLRQFACPGCGRLLDNEVRRAAEPPLWDFRLAREL
jgi:N-methylhydantoinase B